MTTWSRQHYEKMAGIISKMKPCESLDKMIDEYVRMFANDNERFIEDVFREACSP